MNVEELRIFIYALANRDQTGNNLTPDEYNSYLARSNEDYFRKEVGLREQPNGTIYFDNSQVSTDALLPFVTETPLTGNAGIFTFPSNYRHTISAYNSNNSNIVTFLTKSEFDQIINDPIDFPTDEYPYGTFLAGNLKIAPVTTTQIGFSYLRAPAIPFWNYTIVNDEAVYNPVGSVQSEFPDITHITIARIICGYVGVQFRDEEFLQYVMKVQQAGI